MISPLIKELANERVVLLNPSKKSKLPFPLEGVVRLVDKNGRFMAIVLDKETWSELFEYLEYSNPEFWEEIETSRKSGRVSSKKIEQRLGIK